MTWELIANSGCDEIRLGDARAVVRERFAEYRTVKRTPDTETDQFVGKGLMVTYDQSEVVEYIELASPTTPTLAGVPLIERPLGDVIRDLRELGISAERNTGVVGAVIPGWSVALYAPGDAVEGVGVG